MTKWGKVKLGRTAQGQGRREGRVEEKERVISFIRGAFKTENGRGRRAAHCYTE